MSAAKLDLKIEQYATFTVDFQVGTPSVDGQSTVPDNITGLVPRMQVRATADANEILVDLNVGNGRIKVLSPTEGKLQLSLSATDTANLHWSEAVYDLVLVGQYGTRRLLEGTVRVSPGVTR